MEVIQGKPNDKKIVIAQEIAFAKVLAGNNKTYRDRAVKKLRKWLTLRGNGRWAFVEDEFLRIWTGLFYCMWMSDKFLVQEELAESISKLIHCFKKNSDNAHLFIRCFYKRILMDWEGLDQYRIDKFNMLTRRFLRQTLVYCREKDWEESFLQKLMDTFYNVVLHSDNSLGFVMHFINIYPEELAKVSNGKLETKTVLKLIEPFVKLVSRTRDTRIQKETEDFFDYLMRQSDTGIEFDEKFNAWRQQGFPGEGPNSMIPVHKKDNVLENRDKFFSENEEDESDIEDKPLDPRAGSVHVVLPQIPIDTKAIINLLKKHQNSKQVNIKGRRILQNLSQKFEALSKGRFPVKIKKDPILTEITRKKKLSKKNAVKLLEFMDQIDKEPIKTKEYKQLYEELKEQDSDSEEDEKSGEECCNESEDVENDEALQKAKQSLKNKNKTMKNMTGKQKLGKVKKGGKEVEKALKKEKISKELINNKTISENGNHKENLVLQQKKKKRKNRKRKQNNLEEITEDQEICVTPKKKPKINGVASKVLENLNQDSPKLTPASTVGTKRKVLSNWQVQELDSSSPEYCTLKTPNIIRIERKLNGSCTSDKKEPEETEGDSGESKRENPETPKEGIFPAFWETAKAKACKKSGNKNKMFVNPFANISGESKSPGRRISFALEKNMAQENEEYLEEVKNSPRVPFDGSKKPIQSALKSGLAPSPVNPFYRFKRIKI